jgi:hypothetical protein
MDEKVHDVESLTTDLEAALDPVDFGGLEELGRLEGFEQRFLGLGLRMTFM